MSRRLALLVAAAFIASCRRTGEPQPAPPEATQGPAEPRPVAAPPAPISPAPPVLAQAADRYAGGRTLGWWGERLTALRRGGDAALYALAVRRAEANGLEVREGDDSVVVLERARGAR
jgi:hypothetical protein